MTVRKPNLPIESIVLFAGALLFAPSVLSQQITIDTASARAVLKALQEPNLTYDQGMAIARLEGNKGMIREMRELNEADTEEQFARALVTAAHGRSSATPAEGRYDFIAVKDAAQAESILLDEIDRGVEKEIRDRIRPYSPQPETISVRGFVVAGGDGGGYTFGGSDFYLNILRSDDILYAKQTLIHEAFHGVQGAVYREDTERWARQDMQPADAVRGKFFSNSAEIFKDMKNEGTAMFVGTDEIIKESKGATGKRIYAESVYGNEHLRDSAGLLEISVASRQAPRPVPFKLVYNIDFWAKALCITSAGP